MTYIKELSIDVFSLWDRTHVIQVKVKCTRVQALRLCTGRTTQRGSRGITLPFHDRGTGRGWGVSVTPRPLFNPGKDPVPIEQEAGWAPGPVWKVRKISPPPGFNSRTVQPVTSRYTDCTTLPTGNGYTCTEGFELIKKTFLQCNCKLKFVGSDHIFNSSVNLQSFL
jgi:hypothetical protein